jgi:hypothetical protein
MSTNLVKYAFIAGEVSPTLFGRTDLTAYDLGVAEAYNFFVDYRGGLSSRPGFEFCEYVKYDHLPTRMFDFAFSPDLSETYVLLFGDNYVRFIQDGAYVQSTPVDIEGVTQANPAVVTSTSHGLSNGTWITITGVVGMTELNGRTFEVANVTTNTFELLRVPGGPLGEPIPVDSTSFAAYVSGGKAAPIYEVATPYKAEDLENLSLDQYRDLVRITHNEYPIHDLVRHGHDNWEIKETEVALNLVGPTITSGTGSASGDAQVVFAVTWIGRDGKESPQGNLRSIDNIVNYTTEEGSVKITWTAVAGAVSYNVYRSVVASNGGLDSGTQLGFVGSSRGLSFVDPNITPDFTRSPPINDDPFSPGAIEFIEVTNGGSGYNTFSTTVAITDPDGTGFLGQAIVSESGAVVGVKVLSGGSGYTNPTVSFSGGGSGATATADVRPTVGTFPALATIYQQRQIYAASLLQPINVWGSRVKRFNDFTVTDLALDNEAFEFSLDTKAIAPIRHLLVTRGGLLCMTQENVWLLNGGSANEPITPTEALADPQTFTGVSKLKPIPIGSDLLFVEGKGYAVRLLSYNEISRVYSGEDKSIMSNHLFGPGKDIVSWAYQENPFKVVWGVRKDGALLAFTIVQSEEVFAWTKGATKGKFLDVISIREGVSDRVYVTTQRLIQGRWTKFIERMSLQQFENVEDAWCVDCGLELTPHYPAFTTTIYHDPEATHPWTALMFPPEYDTAVGKFLRGGNGIFKVTELLGLNADGNSHVALEMREEPDNWVPESGDRQTFPMPFGEWTLDAPISTFGGLWHLEGEEVAILGDGNVFPNQTVVDGQITLDHAVSRVRIGLPYRAQAQTLPLIVPDAGIEARRKRIVGLGVRLNKSRGLRYGRTLDNLYEMRERTTEPYGYPTRLVNGIRYQMISTSWDENGQTYFVQEDPLPVTLLSVVSDIEVGDDPD